MERNKQLTPFKLAVLQNFPYIEADFDALTNYSLLSKIVEYLNKTIEQQNLTSENTNALLTWFENLDVTEEIENKLDKMAEDGTLTQLIKGYVDPIIAELNEEFDVVKDEVASVVSGSPAGVYPTISALQSADPDHTRIYLVEADGEWYFWNNSTNQWKNGGVYQSMLLGENVVNIPSLDENLKNILDISSPTYTVNDGAYVGKSGNIITIAGVMYSSPIELKKGETILFIARGTGTNIAMISECNENGENIKPQIISIDNTIRNYKYTATKDTYVILSCYSNVSYNAYIINQIKEIKNDIETINNKLGDRFVNYVKVENYYIKFDETIQSTINTFYTQPIELKKGEKITFNAKGYGTNVAMISQSDSSGNNRRLLVQSDGNDYKAYSYTAFEDMFVMLSCQVGTVSPYATIELDLYSLNQINLENVATKDLYKTFLTVGCIGDSLASGEVAYHTGTDVHYFDDYDHSWGQFMARMSGNTYYNFSKGGLTAKTWLTDSKGYPLASQPDKKCDAYIIGLGENDRTKSTLGSIDDIDLTNYRNNNDTFYGNYAGIIQRMKDIQPKAKFFILTMPPVSTTNRDAYNEAIVNICNLFDNCYLIDLSNIKYSKYYTSGSIINSCRRSGHYNAIAYNMMATIISNAINDVMIEKLNEFQQIEFIGTNYQW